MHHTKSKADIGVAEVIADLTTKGYVPCIPLSEHQQYDLVAVIGGSYAIRVQVKYATLRKNGTIELKYRTSWADRKGTHMKRYSENSFDYFAVYCPEKDVVLYVPNASDSPKVIRFDNSLNNQGKYVRWAKDYHEIKKGVLRDYTPHT